MPPESPRFPHRLSRVQRTLLTNGPDALLFLDMKNIRYLTGFTGSDGALLLKRNHLVLLVDGRYTTQAGEEAAGADIFKYRDKIEGIAEVLADDAIEAVGFEAAAISFETYGKLKEKIPDIRLAPLSGNAGIRAIKDESEVACLKKAASLASRTFAAMRDFIKPGIRERDVALELEYRMRQNGAEGVSFSTIVAAGKNSALPHATPGARKLSPGDALVIDFGAIYGGYHSDETCTFFLGYASARQKGAYDIVKEAHDRALAAVKAGVSCREIDRVARDCIEDGGLGKFFSHGTGHGIGLDVHEPPKIAASSEDILEAGMVVTIEPGVYMPGLWGVRIEDTVLVNEDDCEVLTKIPKDFTLLN
ncbi:MAG: Xaa-Pro peptidase family protein [Syntrophales bacterium]|nr:Xaa-Pro peptidase family protein [Syntrophales bacterium]